MNYGNQNGMTRLMYQLATSQSLTLPEAVRQLKEGARMRTVRDTLAKFCRIPADDRDALKARLMEILTVCDPTAKRDSLDRKVRMWLKDDVCVISRDAAMQLAFGLQLSLDEANTFLLRACEEGLHWRDPQDVIYIFALSQGMSWAEATALTARMKDKGLLTRDKKQSPPTIFTEQLRTQVSMLASEDELEDLLRESRADLGSYHNTAYALFMDFLHLLGWQERGEDPKSSLKGKDPMEDDVLTIRDVLTTYLHNNMIPRLQKAAKGAPDKLVLTALQKDVRANWPDETVFSRMIHREADVTRKVLILLFLATDGGEGDYGEMDDELSPEEVFEDMYERLNSMLFDCGFGPLDPRVRFDWMVLYCMCVDESLYIDGRIQRFLSEIFPDSELDGALAGFDGK